MKIIGLKIEKGRIAVAVVEKGFRQAVLLDSSVRSFATDAELVEILKEKSKDWAGARIVSSIPGAFFTQRTIPFPFADRKRLEKALPFEMEDVIPLSLDDVVLDHIVLDSGARVKEKDRLKEFPVLGMVLPKTILRQHLDLLASAGVDPQVIVPSPVGLSVVATMMKSEGCALFLCGRDLCLKSGDTIKAVRHFADTGPTAGLAHTLQALETEYKERVDKAFLLCGDEGSQSVLADRGIAGEIVAAEYGGKKAADAVSLGLALMGEINFRKGEFAYRIADEGARRRKRVLVAAGAAAAFFAVVNLGVKLFVVQSSYGRLDREIKDIYRKTFPEAKVVADPVRQMRDKLNEAQKKFGVLGTGSSALDVMKAVTEGVPKEVRVSFTEFNLEGERLRLQGEAGSFESVDKVKAELQKAVPFAEVTVLDTRMGVDSKVKFRMDIKLKQAI